jgi:sarcosine oxidase subunit alpha
MHYCHEAQGTPLVPRDGWLVPDTSATDVEEEHRAAQNGVGLVDLSALAKFSMMGPGVTALVQARLGESPAAKLRGVAVFDAGGSVLACRLTDQHLLLLATRINAVGLTDWLANIAAEFAVVQSVTTCAYAGMGLVGPRAELVLQRLASPDVSARGLPVGSCAETNLAGIQALLVRPPGGALPTLAVYVAWDLGEYVWEKLLQTGRREELAPVGLEAWRRLTGLG